MLSLQGILISVGTVIVLVALGLAVCIASDRREQRARLKQLRKQMQLAPSVPDDQFILAFDDISREEAIEMRLLLAAILGVDALKIRPEWRFREDAHLQNMDIFIYHAFACRYAPEQLRNQTFQFPKGAVSTVRDLFIEAHSLKRSH